MAGADALRRELKVLEARGVRVLGAPCIGRCEQAPAAVVGRNAIGHATANKIVAAVTPERSSIRREPYIDYAQYRAGGGYALLRECVAGKRTVESVIAEMESSVAARTRAARAFPRVASGRSCAPSPRPRLMAVNIDEGEPGTFKDRYYLERDPHRFLEGMLIAAWAVGIDAVYVYLRDEYAGCRAILTRELAALAADPPCALPAIHLRRGAGAYICGEESAMIESIEGKRGMPRLRPPYVAQVGLFGRPTLEHNMETLFWVRDILTNGRVVVRGTRAQRPQGIALVLGVGTRQQARRASRARGHHGERADRRILRRHAGRARLLRLPARRRIRGYPAGIDG